ncbi:MAG: ATP-binding protein [Bacteroidetes bacterium]|nr:ATP-binding protein [Bacteroidota bacterium]
MNSHSNYFSNTSISCDPEMLDIIKVDQDYRIFQVAEALLTPGGNLFSHPSERFIRALITDIQLRSSIGSAGLSYATLYSFKKDLLDADLDPFKTGLDSISNADPFVRIKTMGHNDVQSFKPDEPLFNFAFITLSGLIVEINRFAASMMSEITIEESDSHPFLDLVRLSYNSLDPWKKTAVQALSFLHNAGIVLPIGLASGLINPAEYTKGLIALKIYSPVRYAQIFTEASDARNFLDCLNEFRSNEQPWQKLIQDGEGDAVEFKSTLRWDIRAGKTNQAIERACLKTISAFLNSRGGVLLIGVKDDGSIEGIETDKFANEDKFLLHLWTLIRTCLGRDFSPYIRTILEKVEEKTICLVHCQPSGRPVFLRQPGSDEEMFIRVGPSSNALDISEALQYIRERFPEKLQY